MTIILGCEEMAPVQQEKDPSIMQSSTSFEHLHSPEKKISAGKCSDSINDVEVKPDIDRDVPTNTGKEIWEVILDTSGERDERQKFLLESIVTHTQMETELRALIASCDENLRLKRIELEAITAEKRGAEKRLASLEVINDQCKNELCAIASAITSGNVGFNSIALDSSLSHFYPAESTQLEESDNYSTDIKSSLEESIKDFDSQSQQIEILKRENAKMRSFCDDLKRENSELRVMFEKKLSKTEEKMKIVATLASSHLTGRMGLEARLQACEKERAILATDNSLVKAHEEVIAFGRTMEVRNLSMEIEKLQRMLRDARESQRVAEDEVARLAALEVESFSESCISSVCTDMTTAQGQDDISDCSTK